MAVVYTAWLIQDPKVSSKTWIISAYHRSNIKFDVVSFAKEFVTVEMLYLIFAIKLKY